MSEVNHNSLSTEHFCQNEIHNQQLKQLSCFPNVLFHGPRLTPQDIFHYKSDNQHSCIVSQTSYTKVNIHQISLELLPFYNNILLNFEASIQ